MMMLQAVMTLSSACGPSSTTSLNSPDEETSEDRMNTDNITKADPIHSSHQLPHFHPPHKNPQGNINSTHVMNAEIKTNVNMTNMTNGVGPCSPSKLPLFLHNHLNPHFIGNKTKIVHPTEHKRM
jgi:hypothetical protein